MAGALGTALGRFQQDICGALLVIPVGDKEQQEGGLATYEVLPHAQVRFPSPVPRVAVVVCLFPLCASVEVCHPPPQVLPHDTCPLDSLARVKKTRIAKDSSFAIEGMDMFEGKHTVQA